MSRFSSLAPAQLAVRARMISTNMAQIVSKIKYLEELVQKYPEYANPVHIIKEISSLQRAFDVRCNWLDEIDQLTEYSL